MAIGSTSVFEVRTAGLDTNGGGYAGGGSDFSQQNAKNTVGNNISATDIIAVGTTTLTSATVNGTSALTGNIVYLQGGTGSLAAGWYQATFVSNVAGVTTFTVDRNVATGTGITCNIGGALLSPGMASSAMSNVSGVITYIQAGTYTITSASTNVTGGCMAPSANESLFVGYTSTRTPNNTDVAPTLILNSGLSAATIFVGGGGSVLCNCLLDGNTQTTSRAINGGVIDRCTIQNFVSDSTSATFYGCQGTTNSGSAFGNGTCIGCEAYANTKTPFTGVCIGCLSYANTGGSTDGFAATRSINCTSYNNGRDGFRLASNTSNQCINCHSEGNVAGSGTGYNLQTNANCGSILHNCTAFNNTTNVSNTFTGVGSVTILTATPLTNATGGVFTLNNISGSGASLRGAGFPALYLRGLTASYPDIGAAQHPDSGGGSAVAIFGG